MYGFHFRPSTQHAPYVELVADGAETKAAAKAFIVDYATRHNYVVAALKRTPANNVYGVLRPVEVGEMAGKSGCLR